ncbi:MAG TPA: hypothetical protein ENH00_04655 [Actinobacteria bacterium]|nr:hypothetical protein [Actinomycetota bacterium]
MRSGERFPADQAEIVFSDVFVEQLEALSPVQAEDVLVDVQRLCSNPAGSHPLHAPLTGWNTLETLSRKQRVAYHARIIDGVGTIDVLCLGPRSDSEVYDMVRALLDTGLLTDETVIQIWDALALLDVVAESVGLDDWDYLPPAAPVGMRKAAVASGALPDEVAALLSKDELEAALEAAWADDGTLDTERAIAAAIARHRTVSNQNISIVTERRKLPRCGAFMPRARRACIRRQGHPGPHRAS